MKSGCTGDEKKKRRSIELPVLKGAAKSEPIAHSRNSRWRAVALIALNLAMIAHIIQWRITGSTVTPIEPSEAMFTLQNGAVNAGFIFFILAILATLIFGRFVCGWGCHVLALQDLCAWLLKKMGLTPRPFRSRLLVFVPLIVALYMFVWPTIARALTKPPNQPLFPQFTNHLITTEFWATFPPWWVAISFLFVCGFMTVYFLGSKGFCTYGCPYGGFFSLADKVAPGRIRVTDACNECGHCTATCTSNVIVHAEVKQYGMVVDSGCMKCMDCVSVCPNDALYFGFGKPLASVAKSVKKNFSLTWPEEIVALLVFGLSYFAVWDVYQLVPMLMALGIAAVTTFLVMRLIRLVRSKDLSFYKYNLKAGGKVKRAGFVFAALSLLWIGVNAHSGFIRYHERAGARAFESLQIPDELALAQTNADQWLSPSDRINIAAGIENLRKANDLGLLPNADALPKLAWFEHLSGNNAGAVELLETAAKHQKGQGRALSLYYRGAILNRMRQPEAAIASLEQAIAERPDLVIAREERGESLWLMGRREQAVAAWSDTVRGNARLPLTFNFLAGAGKPDAAAAYERQADQSTPNDPYFHWMLGIRLSNIGMTAQAEKHFNKAIQLDPSFRNRRN